MITPICAASRGLLSSHLPLGIATDGLIAFSGAPPPPVLPPERERGGGHITGWGLGIDGKLRKPEGWELRQRIIADDNEIFEILAAIMPTLH